MADIDYAFLADFAKIDAASGTLTSVGASWTFLGSPEFPGSHRMSVAGRVRSSMDEGPVTLRITISAPFDAYSITADANLDPGPNPRPYGDDRRIGLLFALDIQVPLPTPGVYQVVVALPDSGKDRVLKFEAETIAEG